MPAVVKKLKKITWYQKHFGEIYENGITTDNVTDSITEFEKALIAPSAPFDRYLKGDKKSISRETERGYFLFTSKGYISCRNGLTVGGNLYSKFGVYENYHSTNFGRYKIIRRQDDRFVFKVLTLLNIELTAPYMHDGKTKILKKLWKLW